MTKIEIMEYAKCYVLTKKQSKIYCFLNTYSIDKLRI